MDGVLRAAERVPNWARALAICVLPVLAFLTVAFNTALLATAFVAWTVLTLFVHAPVFVFDGPLPFSDAGVHVRGEVHAWSEVVAVEPLGERDLQAVLADGRRMPLRVRGRRTRADLRAALARYKAGVIHF